jgi:hypothetical protein
VVIVSSRERRPKGGRCDTAGATTEVGADLVVEGVRIGVRAGVELAVQSQAELPVDDEGGGRVAGRDERAHERSRERLAEGIAEECLAQVTGRQRRVALGKGEVGEPLPGVEVGLLAELALLKHPLLDALLQERSPIECHRLFQGGPILTGDANVEGDDVDIGLR